MSLEPRAAAGDQNVGIITLSVLFRALVSIKKSLTATFPEKIPEETGSDWNWSLSGKISPSRRKHTSFITTGGRKREWLQEDLWVLRKVSSKGFYFVYKL